MDASAQHAHPAFDQASTGTESTSMSDHQLVEDYCNGDLKAFEAIFTKHRRRLTNVARRYAGNDFDVDDIMQDAMLKASRRLDTYRAECALTTWLHRLVMNAGYDHLNHKHRRETPTIDSEVIPHDRNMLLAHNPSEHINESLFLHDALSQLRPEHRQALTLIDIAGYSVVEVAQSQGVAPGTIKSRRWRARQALRDAVA